MTAVVATPDGVEVGFSDEQVAELGVLFRGSVVAPGDPAYDEVRRVVNLAIDRRPGLIVQCSGVADVIDGVRLARDRGLLLAVRAGGHNVAGHGTVTHQQITAQPHPEQRFVFRQTGQEQFQILKISGSVAAISRPAHTPAGMCGHGLGVHQFTAQTRL